MQPVVQKPTPREFFDKNHYVILSGVLTPEECKRLTEYMFDLVKEGKTEKDPQCPLSESIYGAPEYDDLLQKLAKPLGEHIGIELLPCYTYARLYRPGEELVIHKDRPSCEYSATLTLGIADGTPVWPIYFDEEKRHKLELQPGEMAMYKGCDVAHWRPPFKGEWQVQMFLHYVDANGKYKDQYADGRKEFGKPKSPDNMREGWVDAEAKERSSNTPDTSGPVLEWKRPIFNGVMLESMDDKFPGYFPVFSKNMEMLRFTPEECDKIVEIAKNQYAEEAGVGGGADRGIIAKEIRDADLYPVHLNKDTHWIFEKIGAIVSAVNTHHFDYEIVGITHSLQLLHYRHKPNESTDGHYNWHIDSGPGHSALRKISLSVQLSNEGEYEGGELELFDHGGPVIGTKEKGSVHLFPSYMPHKVHPIIRGERWALVIWVHGHKRFR